MDRASNRHSRDDDAGCGRRRHGHRGGKGRGYEQSSPEICHAGKSFLHARQVLPRNFRQRDLIAAAARSPRRLGTDHIDLYQLHWPNLTIRIEEPMRGMEKLMDEGKVRFIGVSNFSVGELMNAQAVLAKQRIVANQVRYSLVERTIEGGLLQCCQKNGITDIAYSLRAMGLGNNSAVDSDGALYKVAESDSK